MNLAIDFGNTYGKAAIFKGRDMIEKFHGLGIDDLINISKDFSVRKAIISTTGPDSKHISNVIPVEHIILSGSTSLPFTLDYKTPDTLGSDRIAAVAGARQLFPNTNCLIIDAGTCITYDLLVNDTYMGGAISPGIEMRYKAMNTFTGKLPLLSKEEPDDMVGKSTNDSIHSGVLNGTLAEIDNFIKKFSLKYGDLQVVICGGDSNYFENKLKASIFAAPELVLTGLNGILLYNAS